jgi:hypothetical protein
MARPSADPLSFVRNTTEQARSLEKAYRLAEWAAALAATPAALERERAAQSAFMGFWADPQRHATARGLAEGALSEGALGE